MMRELIYILGNIFGVVFILIEVSEIKFFGFRYVFSVGFIERYFFFCVYYLLGFYLGGYGKSCDIFRCVFYLRGRVFNFGVLEGWVSFLSGWGLWSGERKGFY